MSNCSCPACTERRDRARPRASTSKDFAEGRDLALAHSAMVAWDMGHPDVRLAINGLIPDGSNAIPMDDERFQRRASTGRAAAEIAHEVALGYLGDEDMPEVRLLAGRIAAAFEAGTGRAVRPAAREVAREYYAGLNNNFMPLSLEDLITGAIEADRAHLETPRAAEVVALIRALEHSNTLDLRASKAYAALVKWRAKHEPGSTGK